MLELKPSKLGLPEKARTKKARKEPGNYPMPDKGNAISVVASRQEGPLGRQPGNEGLQAHLSPT